MLGHAARPYPLKAGKPQRILIINFQIMLSLILIFTAMSMPSTVFILTGFMKTIPYDLEDSGRIDGANEWIIYLQGHNYASDCPLHRPGNHL
ncbi:MAG: hypothetical protein B6241_13235 [Spirochaetaceae bacterium 4572_59]|nr:MAG: hypothetical protein B6241_13235 [Spirochaetaceae bacterium 4572_59]